MILDYKTNLMRMAEEVAYSSKGHMKTADWVSIWLRICICFPIVISIVLLSWQNLPDELARLLNCVAFIFSTLALTSPLLSNPDRAAETIESHMSLGNEYLEVYKDIRNIVAGTSISKDDVEKISQRIKSLDQRTSKFRIGFIARKWSKWKIDEEMDLDWIKKNTTSSQTN